MASRIVRGFNVDMDLSGDIDRLAAVRGVNRSELVNQLLRAGIKAQRIEAAQAAVYAGLGAASLTAITALALLLA